MCETKSFEYNIRKTRLCLTLLYFMYIHKLSTLSMFVLNCYNIYMLTISNQGSQKDTKDYSYVHRSQFTSSA